MLLPTAAAKCYAGYQMDDTKGSNTPRARYFRFACGRLGEGHPRRRHDEIAQGACAETPRITEGIATPTPCTLRTDWRTEGK